MCLEVYIPELKGSVQVPIISNHGANVHTWISSPHTSIRILMAIQWENAEIEFARDSLFLKGTYLSKSTQ